MPPAASFVSSARNHEDVILWRALAEVPHGRYVEVAATPGDLSLTRAFYDRGWSGITVVLAHPATENFRIERLRDTVIDDTPPGLALGDLVAAHGGLELPVHFLVIDAAGAASRVLAGIDLRGWRPWVLVIAATAPGATERTEGAWEAGVLAADYQFCLFDGVSRFYVAAEHAATLHDRLSYPACVLDDFTEAGDEAAEQERLELVEGMRRWRAEALSSWAQASEVDAVHNLRAVESQLAVAANELAALRATLSWKVTRPIRALRRLGI